MRNKWRKYLKLLLIIVVFAIVAMLVKIKFIDPSFSEETDLPQYTIIEDKITEVPDSTVVLMRLLLSEDVSHKKIKGLLEKTYMKIKEGTYKYKAEPIIYIYVYHSTSITNDNWVAMFSSHSGYKYK